MTGAFCAETIPTVKPQAPEASQSDPGALLFLELIKLESNREKRLALMEQFTTRYPKHESAVWALTWMQDTYLRLEAYDKAIQTGEKLLLANPSDDNAATGCLRAAEGKKDSDLVKKWTDRVAVIEKKPAAPPAAVPQKPASPHSR